MFVAISHLELNLLRYWEDCSTYFQTALSSEVSNTVSFLYASLHARQIFQPAINMLSGAKPHNVTFHLHLQRCLYLSLACQSLSWVNTSPWQLLHTFFHPQTLSLSMTPWHLAYCLPAGDTGQGRQGRHRWPPQSTHHSHVQYAYLHTHAGTHRGRALVEE